MFKMALEVAVVWEQKEPQEIVLCCQHCLGNVLVGNGEPEHTWIELVCDLYHHDQHRLFGVVGGGGELEHI